jgi:hypothetical protein
MACRHRFTQVHINNADGGRVRKVLCRAHYKRHMGEDGALEALDEERVTADELSHLLCRHVHGVHGQTFPSRRSVSERVIGLPRCDQILTSSARRNVAAKPQRWRCRTCRETTTVTRHPQGLWHV